MAKCNYEEVLERIEKEENALITSIHSIIEESYRMVSFLKDLLNELKECVMLKGFPDSELEIEFFKRIKPEILGKLIYYNKVYRIETTRPSGNGHLFYTYFEKQLKLLKAEYKDSISNEAFYRYYRSGRTDKDGIYFRLGNIDYYDGLNSNVFEIDTNFSTYYDNKIAHIIANELLYTYILTKINPTEDPDSILVNGEHSKDISWTNSQNALIELIYALHVSSSIASGNIGIRKLALIFQVLFRTPLKDIHHAFHRMKTRSGSKTLFLDQLKKSLEEYMEKDL